MEEFLGRRVDKWTVKRLKRLRDRLEVKIAEFPVQLDNRLENAESDDESRWLIDRMKIVGDGNLAVLEIRLDQANKLIESFETELGEDSVQDD